MKNIANQLVKKLKKRKLQISFVESCTGGLLSSLITSINGSSKVFSLGLVTYSNKSKNIIYGIKELVDKLNTVKVVVDNNLKIIQYL